MTVEIDVVQTLYSLYGETKKETELIYFSAWLLLLT
jgi:hypothetical protein